MWQSVKSMLWIWSLEQRNGRKCLSSIMKINMGSESLNQVNFTYSPAPFSWKNTTLTNMHIHTHFHSVDTTSSSPKPQSKKCSISDSLIRRKWHLHHFLFPFEEFAECEMLWKHAGRSLQLTDQSILKKKHWLDSLMGLLMSLEVKA